MKPVLNMNPWASIWTKPRETIQEIIVTNPKKAFWPLSFIYGFTWLLQTFQTLNLGSAWSLGMMLTLSIVLAIPVGAIAFSLMSIILYWTGKIVNGAASYMQIRAASSWSSVPNLASIVCWIAQIARFGQVLFTQQFATLTLSPSDRYILIAVFALQTIAGIWGIVLFLKTLSQVQKLPMWKTIINVVLLIIVLIAAGYLLTLVGNLFLDGSATQQASSEGA